MSECKHDYQFQGMATWRDKNCLAGSGARSRIYGDLYFCKKCLDKKLTDVRAIGNDYSKPISGSIEYNSKPVLNAYDKAEIDREEKKRAELRRDLDRERSPEGVTWIYRTSDTWTPYIEFIDEKANTRLFTATDTMENFRKDENGCRTAECLIEWAVSDSDGKSSKRSGKVLAKLFTPWGKSHQNLWPIYWAGMDLIKADEKETA